MLIIRKPFSGTCGLTCWGTRTRTKNDRTRICSVTITPYPNVLAIKQPRFDLRVQRYYFFLNYQNFLEKIFKKAQKILIYEKIFWYSP